MKRILRPWSFWLFLLSIPASYVLFVGFFTLVTVATSRELNDLQPSLYGFSIYWGAGSYILVAGCWVVLSVLAWGVKRQHPVVVVRKREPND